MKNEPRLTDVGQATRALFWVVFITAALMSFSYIAGIYREEEALPFRSARPKPAIWGDKYVVWGSSVKFVTATLPTRVTPNNQRHPTKVKVVPVMFTDQTVGKPMSENQQLRRRLIDICSHEVTRYNDLMKMAREGFDDEWDWVIHVQYDERADHHIRMMKSYVSLYRAFRENRDQWQTRLDDWVKQYAAHEHDDK